MEYYEPLELSMGPGQTIQSRVRFLVPEDLENIRLMCRPVTSMRYMTSDHRLPSNTHHGIFAPQFSGANNPSNTP